MERIGRARRWAWGLGVLSLVALTWHSIAVRTDEPAPRRSSSTASGEGAPTTGAVLIDLSDEISAEARVHVARRVIRAIAPKPWREGTRALGEQLSRAAQLFRIRPPASEVAEVLRLLEGHRYVEAVERERIWSLPDDVPRVRLSEAVEAPAHPQRGRKRFVPNDPYYKYQWHLSQIQMPEAWARARGDGVVVAVIDTGVVARDHGRFKRAPDLHRTRFVRGRDFVDRGSAPDDEHGHGTHVAGTIAQSTHNGLGVAGVAPEAAIMPIRVLDRRGAGRLGTVAAGIRWAADHGADVINLSLGGPMPSQTINRAIEHAHAQGVVVIAAAGNTGRARVGHPAMHRHTVAVGAVRYDEALTFYSAHGRGLDLVAPGGDLRVDQNGDGLPDGVLQNTLVRGDPGRHDYLVFQGTSMAAPHVSGAAALLRGVGVRDPDTVEALLTKTARDRGDTTRYGAGLLQASDALAAATRGLGGLRGLAAGALGLVLLLGLRRRGRLDVSLAPTVGLAAAAAGGLAVLPWQWLPGVWAMAELTSNGLPGTLAGVLGPWGGALALHAGLPLLAMALLLGSRAGRAVAVALAFGFAGFLLAEAAVPSATLTPMPEWLVGPWLVVQALASALLGRVAATRPRA